jgi:demethylmenaquinone methyltransferase/2-methoxy-6-polyprenyl-1,4-benzoquinol methylase
MGRAEDLGFAGESFDAVSVTFLLRYVDDAESTMREIIRVLKPGGRLLSLEFGVPSNPLARALWHVYTKGVLPVAGALVSKSWKNVGDFLGPSITHLYQSNAQDDIRELWRRLGIQDVQVTRLSLGGAVVMSGVKGNQPRNTGQ